MVAIGGFLGSGKTTLVNQILRRANGRRIVVFVNDFGAINIDHALVETVEGDRISLKNGCVCCSLNGDLVAGVAGFAREPSPPDAVLIEASGVADPRALDASLAALEAAELARLDTRLYILDACEFQNLGYQDAEDIIDHAAASDLVLLNKVDIATHEQIAAITCLLNEAAPYSRVLETEHCYIDADVLLGHIRCQPTGPRSPNAFSSTNLKNHAQKYEQWSFETEALIDRQSLEEFARLLPETCLRAKGVLRVLDEPDAIYLFNLVGYRATLERLNSKRAQSSSQIVVIGKKDKLDPSEIEQAFRRMISRSRRLSEMPPSPV